MIFRNRLIPCVVLGCFAVWVQLHAAALAAQTTFSVRAYGASGDGVTLDTEAVNRAIAAAVADGGGTVEFPAGNYLCYSIRLQSRVELRLGAGATLIAADPPKPGEPGGYDLPEVNDWSEYQDFG